jgi:hypothetical protein
MTSRLPITRRRFSAGLAAAAAAPAILQLPLGTAQAQEGAATATSTWKELARIAMEAQKLGLSVPRMSLGPETASDDFASAMPAIVDLMDSIESEASVAPAEKADAAWALRERASELLSATLAAEKMPREEDEPDNVPSAQPRWKPPKFEDIAADYQRLFATCVVRPERMQNVRWYTSRVACARRGISLASSTAWSAPSTSTSISTTVIR